MKPLIGALILLLTACEQNIIQTVKIEPQNPSSASPSKISPVNAQATARPAAAPVKSPLSTPEVPASPRPSVLSEIPLAPISGPSAPPIYPQEIDLFAASIPEPELTRSYDSRHIEVANVFWQSRYERVRQDPYEILKMYLDAALIAWHNETLAAKLNQTLLYSKTPLFFPNFARLDAQAVAKSEEYAIRSYYRGTLSLNNFLIPDFEQRHPHIVTKNSRGEWLPLSAPDLKQLAPPFPRNGDSFKVNLLSSISGKTAEVTLIYQNTGWRIDFWTPNILVLNAR